MPRKRRIEYPGAVYHIISRGNYRKDLFVTGKSGESFEKALFEAINRCGWVVYAYVIMSNHYHLALKTPEPNLVAGMKWLQSTFATRFNRFTGERGHVFQGRYKSLIVEEDRSLLGLIDYIHLNPVRAGLCSVKELKGFKLSSYPKYWKRKVRSGLDRSSFLGRCGVSDSVAGMRSYEKHLSMVEASDPEKKKEIENRYSRGWFIGSSKAKKALAQKLVKENSEVSWEGVDLKAINEERWELIVVEEMNRLGIAERQVKADSKGSDWKVEIARKLRKETTVSNPWISDRLNMGHPNYVSNLFNKSL